MRGFPVLRFVFVAFLTGIVLLAESGPAQARLRPMRPNGIPVERVLENAKKCVATQPEDPNGHYVLGRVQYYAFAIPRDAMIGVIGSLSESAVYAVPIKDYNAIENYRMRQNHHTQSINNKTRM